MDETEVHVRHRRSARDGDRQREEPDAALRVERAVDRIDHEASIAAGTEAHLAALLGHEHAVEARRFEPPDDPRLRSSVDRRRVVTALARADHGLAVGTGRQLREREPDVLDRSAAEVEPAVSQAGGRGDPR